MNGGARANDGGGGGRAQQGGSAATSAPDASAEGNGTAADLLSVVWGIFAWITSTVLSFVPAFASDNGSSAATTPTSDGNGNASSAGPPPAAGSSPSSSLSSSSSVPLPAVDDAQPTTTIRYRLANGAGSKQHTFNVGHTLADVYAVAASYSPDGDGGVLFGGFPPKELANDATVTIEAAGIEGAALRQKLPSLGKSKTV